MKDLKPGKRSNVLLLRSGIDAPTDPSDPKQLKMIAIQKDPKRVIYDP